MSDIQTMPVSGAAVTRRSRRVPVIWVVPVLAAAIGAWLAWDTYSKRGPVVTVSFTSAEGLQAGQSQLKYKDIVFGTVKSLDLTPEHARVLVKIETTSQATSLLTDQTIFWVAKPRLFAGSVSGLETLVSGSYVAMMPGAEGARAQRDFVGHEDPPILPVDAPGREFLLRASRIGSISLGSPVFFRDLEVGQVLGWDIAKAATSVTIRAFVRAPYDEEVHDETRFWNASGVSLKLAATGVELQIESLRALLLGGVAFETPEGSESGIAAMDHPFPLYADRDAANEASYQRKIPLMGYFSGSVRGLGRGSPVTVHGLAIGRVLDVHLTYDPAKDAVLAPVRFEIDPERILGIGQKAFATPAEGVAAMVAQGWRASLQSASLLTGQQEIALELMPDAAPAQVTTEGTNFVIPVVESGGIATLTSSASELMKSVMQIPFKQIGADVENILKAVNGVANGPELQRALTDLAAMMGKANGFVAQLDSGAGPAMRQLPQVTTDLEKTLTGIDTLTLSLNNGYGTNTKFNHDLERLLVQLNDAVQSMRSLADLLARHPEALIKGRPGGGTE
jgi:paraquat-inducible protein B